jgi:beta-lactam-binding protein with PASTA domain
MAIGAFHGDAFDLDAFSDQAFLFEEIGILVPDVVGQSQAAGTAVLEGDGFAVAIVTAYSSVVPAGDIISQAPAAGIEVAVGSTVTITVSLGEAPVDDDGFFEAYAQQRKRRELKKVITPAEAQRISDAELAVLLLWMM